MRVTEENLTRQDLEIQLKRAYSDISKAGYKMPSKVLAAVMEHRLNELLRLNGLD